jgi:hypothetical protein
MPITYHIDHDQRLVDATADGVLTDADIFGYQREVWSRPDVAGYDEVIDMTRVSTVEFPSRDRMAHLARLSASMDAPGSPSRFAIVAQSDFYFGLGRMYQAFREMNKQGTKVVGVFRTRGEAMQWLGKGMLGPSPPKDSTG